MLKNPSRRLSLYFVLVAFLLAACGSDADPNPSTTSTVSSSATTGTAGGGGGAGGSGGMGGSPPLDRTVEVVAGNTGTGFVDGTGIEARFSGPSGAAMAPDGSAFYVADTFNALIRRVDVATGAVTTVAGKPGIATVLDGEGTEALVQSPRAMAFAPDGSAVYFADGPTIRRMTVPGHQVSTVAGLADTPGNVDDVGADARLGFLLHSMVFLDADRLLIGDRSNKTLRTLTLSTGAVATVLGGDNPTNDHVDGVGDVARLTVGGLAYVDATTVYMADTFNATIRVVDPTQWSLTTVAGTPGQSGDADGQGAAARFDIPQQLLWADGALWVFNFAGTVRRVDPSNGFAVTTPVGVYDETFPRDGNQSEARFGVAFGPSLYDAGNNRILYNDRGANSFRTIALADFAVATFAGAKEPYGAVDGPALDARFNGPNSIAVDTDDRWFVSDAGNDTIREVDLQAGTVQTFAGAAGEEGATDGDRLTARFSSPAGLALDRVGQKLYVSDSGNHTVRVIDLTTGNVSTLAGTAGESGGDDGMGAAARFDRPAKLTLGSQGDVLFLADRGNATVRRIEVATGAVTTVAGLAGEQGSVDDTGAAARFVAPADVAWDEDGNVLFVADAASFVPGVGFEGSTIRRIDLATGAVTTYAGRNAETGIANGDRLAARFNGPSCVELAPGGDALFVCDGSNHLLRRIDLTTEQVSYWLGDPAIGGGITPGMAVDWNTATLYFPGALEWTPSGQVAMTSEDAVLLGSP